MSIDTLTDENKHEINEMIKGVRKNRGPLGYFWFFNISSFQTAFIDHLRTEGLGHNNERWFLSRGGDPVNTPELFKYSLYRFMQLQMNHVFFEKNRILRFFSNNPINGTDVNNWAANIFGAFMYKFYAKEVIKVDKQKESIFAETSYKIINESEELKAVNNLIEHFRHLLYILAFDTGISLQIAW